MACKLEAWIIDGGDGTVKVIHSFYGLTEEEARTYYREHTHSCEYFAAAVKDGRVLEEIEEIDDDELPEVEETED